METKAVKIIRKHLGNDQVSNIFNDNEPLWDDIVSAVTEALEGVTLKQGRSELSFDEWLICNNYKRIQESDFFDENFITFKESELLEVYKKTR